MFQLLAVTVGLFISTNLDDMVVLLLLNEEIINRRLRVREVMYGQVAGILVIGAVSWLVSIGLSQFAPSLTRWLGILPILIGLKMLITNLRNTPGDEQTIPVQTKSWQNVLAILGLTLAGGGDNLAVYIPVLQHTTPIRAAVMILLFIPLTLGWIGLSILIARIPPIKWVLAQYTDKLVPAIFIGLGILLLFNIA